MPRYCCSQITQRDNTQTCKTYSQALSVGPFYPLTTQTFDPSCHEAFAVRMHDSQHPGPSHPRVWSVVRASSPGKITKNPAHPWLPVVRNGSKAVQYPMSRHTSLMMPTPPFKRALGSRDMLCRGARFLVNKSRSYALTAAPGSRIQMKRNSGFGTCIRPQLLCL